jgi:hypothetical protein
MNNDLETIAKRYWEIYNSFDGQTHLIDLEIETINMLVEELFYNGDMDSMPKILTSIYYLGKINQQFEKNGK